MIELSFNAASSGGRSRTLGGGGLWRGMKKEWILSGATSSPNLVTYSRKQSAPNTSKFPGNDRRILLAESMSPRQNRSANYQVFLDVQLCKVRSRRHPMAIGLTIKQIIAVGRRPNRF